MLIERDKNGISVRRTPQQAALIRQNASHGQRPYVHPLLAPDGVGEVTEDAPEHHPWQHGLYVGLNDVNGDGFWSEGLAPERNQRDGSFDIVECEPLDAGENEVSWRVRTRWIGSTGTPLLVETQQWRLTDCGDSYTLDLDWVLEGLVRVTFGRSRYGGPFLRMPFREEAGGAVLTSEGTTNVAKADQQRARWVSVALTLPDREHLGDRAAIAAVTVMDHPENPEHPVPWRVDSQYGVSPSRCIAAEWVLPEGRKAAHRHRFLVTLGAPDGDTAEASYRSFMA